MYRFSKIFLTFLILLGCNPKVSAQSDYFRVVQHMETITKADGYRNYKNIFELNQTAKYIFSVFSQYADTTYYQTYQVDNETYKNVVCRLGSVNNRPLVVVGAHYDVAGDTEGADDNASGVVALLELVRLLSKERLNYSIEFVAYCLEEPPFFRTENMGSFIHAKSLHETGIPVYGMVCFDMIGYFDNKKRSQSYPVKLMKIIYGSKGNYILLTGRTGSNAFVKNFSKRFKKSAAIKTKSIKVPPSKVRSFGVDLSDHLNYWHFGYDALMISNTANYRNPNYHKKSDMMETLDINKMMKVIDATALAIMSLH